MAWRDLTWCNILLFCLLCFSFFFSFFFFYIKGTANLICVRVHDQLSHLDQWVLCSLMKEQTYTWLGFCRGVCPCVLLQDLCRAVHRQNEGFCESVMLLLLFRSRRHKGKIAELHLPTLSLFQLMIGQLWSHRKAFSEHHGTHPFPLNMIDGIVGVCGLYKVS